MMRLEARTRMEVKQDVTGDSGTLTRLFGLAGRRALITGSSRGIGFGLAQALAGAGASVILNGRDRTVLDRAAQQLRQQGATVDISAFDVTDPAQIARAIRDVEAAAGAIDILVNCAGIQRRGALETFVDDDWRQIMATNLDSMYYVSKAVVAGMISRGRGKIINIGSVQCELARPGIAPYTASKGAVKNLTKGMCADWARHGLQINAIGPGYYATELNKALYEDPVFDEWLRKRTPAGRWGQIQDLHGAVVFLASEASNFVNGQTLYVDGGLLAVI
jgi:gluconate 5-dehydrogenase